MFCWKIKYWWKVINVVIVGSLAATVPLSFNSMLDTGMIKLRIFSIGISFLILCEIMTKNERFQEKEKPYHAVAKPVYHEEETIEDYLYENE